MDVVAVDGDFVVVVVVDVIDGDFVVVVVDVDVVVDGDGDFVVVVVDVDVDVDDDIEALYEAFCCLHGLLFNLLLFTEHYLSLFTEQSLFSAVDEDCA